MENRKKMPLVDFSRFQQVKNVVNPETALAEAIKQNPKSCELFTSYAQALVFNEHNAAETEVALAWAASLHEQALNGAVHKPGCLTRDLPGTTVTS